MSLTYIPKMQNETLRIDFEVRTMEYNRVFEQEFSVTSVTEMLAALDYLKVVVAQCFRDSDPSTALVLDLDPFVTETDL